MGYRVQDLLLGFQGRRLQSYWSNYHGRRYGQQQKIRTS
jgi:hypothetical protein